MIEMLGVLAIIGVLSVGGIAGYSKAMMKYKINKTVDQISTFVANTRTLFSSQKKYTGLDVKVAKKAHLVPDEMIVGSTNNYSDFENAFGGNLYLGSSDKSTENDDKAFVFMLDGIPEEACMELATMDWGSGSSSGLIVVEINPGSYDHYVGCTGFTETGHAAACPNGSKVPVPMPVSVAAQACTDSNDIQFRYY